MNEESLKNRLQFIAKEKQIHFNACWKQLVLERFLARISASPHNQKFIFKGGFLLSYLMEIGRETVDLDFLLTRLNTEKNEIEKVFKEISSLPFEDGFSYHFEKIDTLDQPHMRYPGFRTVMAVSFGKMKDRIHVDVGVGDVVEPEIRKFGLFEYRGKPIFEKSLSLLVYPVETIFSEKLETILSKGAANSRMKDYHDVYLLIREKKLRRETLKDTALKTFRNRGRSIQKIGFDEQELKALQKLWTAHLKGLGDMAHALDLPPRMEELIALINSCVQTIC